MKKFLSILLSVLFAIALLGTLLLGIARKHLQPSTITNLAGEIIKPIAYEKHDNGLFYPDEWNVVHVVDYELPEGIDFSNLDLESLDIGDIINAFGEEYGFKIDQDFISEILTDPETSNLVNEYTTEIVDYITGTSNELNIDSVKLEKVVNKTIDKYEAKTGEKIDRTGLSDAISDGVKSAVVELTASLDVVKEENSADLEILKKVMDILSLRTLLFCIAICIILAGIIFAINGNIFVTFRYVAIPAIVAGFILFIGAVIIGVSLPSVSTALKVETGLPESLVNIVLKLIRTVISDIKITGLITDLIGVILCVLGFTLYKGENKEIVENK